MLKLKETHSLRIIHVCNKQCETFNSVGTVSMFCKLHLKLKCWNSKYVLQTPLKIKHATNG